MKLFCIFDKKTGEYSSISLVPNYAVFARDLANLVNNDSSSSLLSLNSVDFDIYCVGEFDNRTGVIVPKCEFIANVAELKETKNG